MRKSRAKIDVKLCQIVLFSLLLLSGARSALAQDVGYVIVTHETATTEGLEVFETFGENRGGGTTQAGVLSSEMSTNGVFFVSTSRNFSRDLGVAIANPGSTNATITMTLRREDGTIAATKSIPLNARQQTAQFVTQLFGDRTPEIGEFTGSLVLQSNTPVAMVGLRFRGPNFSTLPLTNLSPPIAVPVRENGAGGAGAFILPHFAAGGGWYSEVVVVNYSTQQHYVHVDFFKQDGSPLVVTMNGQTKSSFTSMSVPAGGVLTLSSRDASGNSPF